jgi:hypothetical protein
MKKWTLLLLLVGAACAADPEGASPSLFFSRSFPGSVPAYFQVTLQKTGEAEYREAVDDNLPLKFKLPQADADAVFGLAEKLDYFKHPLDSPLKVAFMGTKTFRYENGGEKSEVKFNYSEEVPAQSLVDWFERMGETASHRIGLERAAKYDHLGVMKALVLLQSAMERGRVVAPEQFLPMLDRVANNETYMHTARARAAEIAEGIRGGKKQQ